MATLSSTPASHAAGSTPQNTRLFYLTSQSMSLTAPSTPSNLTFRRGPASFNYGLLSGPLTVSGTITFSLWINWVVNTTASPPSVTGTFDYKFPGGGSNWNHSSSTAPTIIPPGLHNVNATYTVGAGIPLTIGTQLTVGLKITSIPKKANDTTVYG